MRFPRVRFTVRRMMVGVAVTAFALVFLIPACNRLFWLYNTPGSVNLCAAEIGCLPLGSARPGSAGRPPNASFTVGQPVTVQCSYECEAPRVAPTGLFYRATLVANLRDAKSWKVVESRRETHILISGIDSWKVARGKFSCDLTPRSHGGYAVQYEINVTDLFGRSNRAALNTTAFVAH